MATGYGEELLALQEAVVGRYSIDRELGRGGMGIVFLARDVALDRPVAIKLFPPELARQERARERFLHEARIAAKLSHPHVVPIHAVEEHGELVFFAMAYIDGDTLTERLTQRGPLGVRDGVRIMREVAWALAHAHAQGVVHRDIKPDNILIERGSGRALVADFGIASVAEVDSTPDAVLGTPAFMSPEQARGDTVDARSDIYSLGVVAFLTLSGRYPFDGNTPAALLAHHLRTPAPRLAEMAPGVPRKLSAIVEMCLKKDPAERVQRADALADALSDALEARGEIPVPVRYFVDQAQRRQRSAPPLAYVLFGFIVLPVFLFGASESTILGLTMLGLGFGIPFTSLVRRIRRVLSAGYGEDDVAHAFMQAIESRREELAFLFGPDYPKSERRLRRAAYGLLGAAGVAIATTAAVPFPAQEALILIALAGTGVGAIVGLQAERRSDRVAKRQWKFWKGRIGRWLFRIARLGLKPALQSTALTHRPTEMAVGMAVLGLWEALPRETREALPDLPEVVANLEADAQRMRARVEELTELLLHGGEDEQVDRAADDSVAGQRHRAIDRIRVHRDEAQRQMQAAVAALERLRVDLLRMNAGSQNLTAISTNLGSARELADDIGRLMEGQAEIERLLHEKNS